MAVYKPRKFKRQRRQRGQDKLKAKQRYRKNRQQNRMRAKKRYKQVRNNPAFKQRKTRYKKNPGTRRRLASVSTIGIEFLWASTDGLVSGCILEVDTENMELTLSLETGGKAVVDVEPFLSRATFYEEEDIDRLFNMLDEGSVQDDMVYCLEDDEMNPITKLANRYLAEARAESSHTAALDKIAGKHLLDWLRRRSKDLKLVVENKVRIYVDKGVQGGVFILEVPMKPLKSKKMRIAYAGVEYPQQGMSPFIPSNIAVDAKFGKSDDFPTAVRKLQKALKEAEKLTEKGNPDRDLSPWFPNLQQGEVNYLEVPPADAKDFVAKGKDFQVSLSWGEWKAYSSDSDFARPEGAYYTGYQSKSPTAARKMFKMLKAKPDALKSVSWGEFGAWLAKHKIAAHNLSSSW